MVKTFMMKVNAIQPTQLYVSSSKLEVVLSKMRQAGLTRIKPVPVKMLDGEIVLTDGHTRAFAAFLLGFSEVPVCWEDEELDWEEYRICVEWCKKEGIRTISDLKDRVLSHMDYKVLWYGRCRKMQEDLQARRKTQKRNPRSAWTA